MTPYEREEEGGDIKTEKNACVGTIQQKGVLYQAQNLGPCFASPSTKCIFYFLFLDGLRYIITIVLFFAETYSLQPSKSNVGRQGIEFFKACLDLCKLTSM